MLINHCRLHFPVRGLLSACASSRRWSRRGPTPAPTLQNRITIPQRLFTQSARLQTAKMASESTPEVPTLTLNDGNTIPMLAYGVGTARARMGNTDGNSIDPELVSTILMAIRIGYRHFDGAQAYGNEAELGQALKQSGLPRSDFYVTTKFFTPPPTTSIETHFATSLAKLQLDYVDQYLIHAPYCASSDADLQAKWAEMEAIRDSGRARSIGVSNFLRPHLERVLETARVVPAINQIEFHPYLQRRELIEFNKEHGIATSAYAPLGALVRGRPGPMDQYYLNLARKYDVSEADVALRWCVDQGVVAITTSSKEERLKGYLAHIGGWDLSEREVQNIRDIGAEKHLRLFWTDKFDDNDRS